ncbi:MAG: DUF4292 domain-containing protein [Massilibacteroides sp.]|nr:DUF4292 domain-containing protein [Massilibacteroides sp.]MDD3062057.1 DUF4292 domain-containing protein [Massilibacteroides sp.]MDD4116159.1 DUF4292 domain-containing protein [Massilibacteroides sp.]MDD4659601.1 DUF4292 domain-containing protein [Massilibacteroides sp.]
MKIKTVYIILYAVSLFLLLFSACKSVEKVGTVVAGEAKSSLDFFNSMQERVFQYETLSARLNIEIITPEKNLSSRVDLKMVKDSAFQLSIVPMLGIEVFRIEFSRDSVKAMDRLNKRYVAEGYEQMKGKLPVDFNFYNLQALFTNRIFLPGERTIQPEQYRRFKLTQDGPKATAKTSDALGLSYTFVADGEEKLLSLHATDKEEQYHLYWDYKDFRMVENQPFPMLMDIRIVSRNKQSGKGVLSFFRVEPDVPVTLDFTIPSKYKKITFDQLMKGLSGRKNE